MDDARKEISSEKGPSIGRRDLMKLGVGAGAAMAIPASAVAAAQPIPVPAPAPQAASAMSDAPTGGLQRGQTVSQWPDIAESQAVVTSTSVGYTVHTGPGWVNNSGRAFGNGPMDTVTQRMVDFADSFSESQMSPSHIETVNNAMVDTVACLFAGFESEPARINARLSQMMPMSGALKSTMLGYGIATTPEMAAFANGSMIRHTDFNVTPHNTENMGGILAMGEILHSSGLQVMGAITIVYEVLGSLAGIISRNAIAPGRIQFDDFGHAPAVALAISKMMGLNKDQMGNAISLALLPHMPMYSRVGVQSMWKGCHSSESVRNGVWAALLAREGMTGPCMPFEGRDGLIAHLGPPTSDVRLPVSHDGRFALETALGQGFSYKRFPAEGTTTAVHEFIVPSLRAWAKPEEIASMEMQTSYYTWQETCEPTKWDPRSREQADHSMPYELARGILGGSTFNNGYVYFDSFTKENYMDPKARALMNKLTIRPNLSENQTILTVRKTSGEEKIFKTQRDSPMTRDDIIAKFNKSAEFHNIDKGQADKILKQWMNFKDVKDINEVIQTAAKFGQPRPLSDKTPAKIS